MQSLLVPIQVWLSPGDEELAALQDQVPLAACYICQLSSVPGKFLPQKAKALGVASGPLFGKLKNGNAVMGKDRMIQPHEVLFHTNLMLLVL